MIVRFVRIIILLLLASHGGISSGNAQTADPADHREAQQALENIEKQLEETTTQIEDLRQREKDAISKARALREEIEITDQVRTKLDRRYNQISRQLSTHEKQIRKLEEWNLVQQEILSRILATSYKKRTWSADQGHPLGIPSEDLRRLTLARHATAAQGEFCEALADSLAGETGRYHTLRNTQEQVRGAVADKNKVKEQAERQLAQSERQAFAIRQQRAQELDEFERIQREAQMFAELIDRLTELPEVRRVLDYDFPAWKGRVHWPLEGEVKSTVGRKIDRQRLTETFETGMFIAGEPGAAVVNAADGEVAFAGRRRGLGNVVIVGHGSDYFSVFAHLDHVAVIVGAVVYAGDEIGTVGNSHPRFGPGILFELRHGREVLDPLEWLK